MTTHCDCVTEHVVTLVPTQTQLHTELCCTYSMVFITIFKIKYKFYIA
jgi:hypothetical protein